MQPVLLELDTEMEEAAASLGARPLTIFRRVVLPNLAPAIVAGAALAFARAVGEFGSLVLISGNIPFDTEVSSVYIFGQIESGNTESAAAVSVVLLAISVGILFLINAARPLEHAPWPLARPTPGRRTSSRAGRWRATGCARSRSATSRCCC